MIGRVSPKKAGVTTYILNAAILALDRGRDRRGVWIYGITNEWGA